MIIGGNVTCKLKLRIGTVNEIGENISELADYMSITGWLDLMSQQTDRATFNAKLEQASHVFICDYVAIDKKIRELVFVDDKGSEYDVLFIDNPMGMKRQLEIYLKYVGD